jgi:hypothetical protein
LSEEEGGSVWRGENPRSVMWAPVLIALAILALGLWLTFGYVRTLNKDGWSTIDGLVVQIAISFLTGLAIWFGLAHSLRNQPMERRLGWVLGVYVGIGVILSIISGELGFKSIFFWPSFVYYWILCDGMNKCF